MKKIKVAVIGFGYWGPNIVRNFHSQLNCDVEYVVDSSDERLAIVNENLIGISPYPNPTRNFISFTNIENVSKFRVSIFDFHGKEIIRNQSNPTKINLSSLKSGQYIIKIESEGSIRYEKIFKI